MSRRLSSPQERLLRLLGRYSQTLEKAWDVTREISLPGLSESLGVVRSALNAPLNSLETEGLIFKRMAHVVGGGSRRRNVYHLTKEGRILFDSLGEETLKPRKSSSSGSVLGDIPQIGEVFGRSELIQSAVSLTEEHHSFILSGLPGIGKTTVGVALANHLTSEGRTLRWATADEFSDFEALCSAMALPETRPSDFDALCDYLADQCRGEFFVVDDVHLISQRHLSRFHAFCKQIEEVQGPKFIFIGREPLVSFEHVERLSIPPLDIQDAVKLLGEFQNEEEREHIVERLGGHPLAIQLYHKETTLPEANSDIQSYVEDVVLSTLDDSTRSGLDHLVLLPRPIEASKAYDDEVVGTLDESAFLRWTTGMEKMELQHLIRNVRRSTMSSEVKLKLHREAVKHWESCAQTLDDQIILLYHRIGAESDELEVYCNSAFDTLASTHSNALSILLEQAIDVSQAPSHLHYLAAKIALQRCEPVHAHNHLSSIEDEGSFNEITMSLAYLEGRIDDADLAINTGLTLGTQQQKNQLAISAASRRLDDRREISLSKENIAQIKHYLGHVVLPDDPIQRTVTVVALTMVQHALALTQSNFVKAETLRKTLVSIGGVDDAIVLGLEAKAALRKARENNPFFSEAIKITRRAIEQQHSILHRDSLRLTLVEALLEHDEEQANAEFLFVSKPNESEKSILQHRLDARWWMCTSQLNPSLRQAALKEAITKYRAAGCPRVANTIEARLHALL